MRWKDNPAGRNVFAEQSAEKRTESRDDERTRARKKALVLLTGMDRTEHQLREKLEAAGFSESAVNDAIEYVRSYGYIDDRRYAEHFIEIRRSGKSLQRIRMDLVRRGVPRDLIDEAIRRAREEDEDGELELAMRLARKKLKGRAPEDERERQKLYAYLVRQGFSGSDALKVLSAVIDS